MVWYRRKAVIVAAITAAVGLAVAEILVVILTNRPAPFIPPKPSPTPTPTPHHQLRSPFTGLPVKALGRVLVAKIDNLNVARPQTGLSKADIIYLLPVEGGLSRIMPVFSAHVPEVLGPVRSARVTDIDLLRQYGKPAFAYSGADPLFIPQLHRARAFHLSADGGTAGYYRDSNRFAPHNLYAHARQLMTQAPDATRAHDIGFRFGPAPAGGIRVAEHSTAFSGAEFGFTWSASRQRWLISMDGAPATTTEAGRLAAATVVIQHTRITLTRFDEGNSPDAHSTGSGEALVLRNGRAYHAHWSRPSADHGTTYTTSTGKPMTFARGQVWIVLTG